jgi:hypothetical protein
MLSLETTRLLGAIVVGAPCYVALVLMSRDGARWLQIVERRWRDDARSLVSVACGSAMGAAAAVLIVMLV